MSLPSMADYLVARATAMAALDGAPFNTMYLVGATNALQTELFAARDQLLIAPPVTMEVAGAPHDGESGQIGIAPDEAQVDEAVPTVESAPARRKAKAQDAAPDADPAGPADQTGDA